MNSDNPIYSAVTTADKAEEWRLYFTKKLLEHTISPDFFEQCERVEECAFQEWVKAGMPTDNGSTPQI